ncbi:(2Fe-2S)-binding protein [Hymenobacter lapidiphilus]|uniref:(2Fe-2S)-binding protein n=1 Tax=Hymenobacter lapidiphilus TaxID=2608003 RepID=UPI003744B170
MYWLYWASCWAKAGAAISSNSSDRKGKDVFITAGVLIIRCHLPVRGCQLAAAAHCCQLNKVPSATRCRTCPRGL